MPITMRRTLRRRAADWCTRRDNPGGDGRRYTARPCAVDQVIPSLASRDAIGVHTMTCATVCARVGIDSDIFYGSFTPDVRHEGRPVTELGRPGATGGCSTSPPSAAPSTTFSPRAPSPSW